MLTRGHEKAISLTYVYTETVTRSFESHGAYVEHTLFRLQGILDLDRRNTHQAQQRQKLKYDRAIRYNAYNIGEPYVPQKGSPMLIKRGVDRKKLSMYYTIAVSLSYFQGNIHFEHLKPVHGETAEVVALSAGSGEVVVVMDRVHEHSAEEIPYDCSQPSYRKKEPLSEALKVSLPRRRHWIDTSLCTTMLSEAVVCTTSSLTILSPIQRVHILTTWCPMHQTIRSWTSHARSCRSHARVANLFQTWIYIWVFSIATWSSGNSRSQNVTCGYICSPIDKPIFEGCVPNSIHVLSNGTANLKDIESANNGLSNTDELTTQCHFPGIHRRGMPRVTLTRGLTRTASSQYQDTRSRAQKRPGRKQLVK